MDGKRYHNGRETQRATEISKSYRQVRFSVADSRSDRRYALIGCAAISAAELYAYQTSAEFIIAYDCVSNLIRNSQCTLCQTRNCSTYCMFTIPLQQSNLRFRWDNNEACVTVCGLASSKESIVIVVKLVMAL